MKQKPYGTRPSFLLDEMMIRVHEMEIARNNDLISRQKNSHKYDEIIREIKTANEQIILMQTNLLTRVRDLTTRIQNLEDFSHKSQLD